MNYAEINEKISAWFRTRNADWIKTFKPNYFTSEAANARLLEAANISIERLHGADVWHTYFAHPEYVKFGMFRHADRKTAVVLAFCKFAGI